MKIKYTPITKRTYEINNTGIQFELEINGKKATGYWQARNQYHCNGVDINEVEIDKWQRLTIFADGGTRRSYEIRADLKRTEKQPKSLWMTGATLSIANLKQVFIDKIKNPGNANLTKEFKEYFGLA